MNIFSNFFLTFVVVLIGIIFFGKPTLAVAPVLMPEVAVAIIEIGETRPMKVNTTGRSNIKIECVNCEFVIVTDHKDGMATVSWNTTLLSFVPSTLPKNYI